MGKHYCCGINNIKDVVYDNICDVIIILVVI